MAKLLALLALTWVFNGAEPYVFVYFARSPRPDYCDHPSKCGDLFSYRVLVESQNYLQLSRVQPGTYYVSATSSYDRKLESEFSNELLLTITEKK